MINKLYNSCIWFIKNTTSICLVFVVLTSVHPFVSDNHSHNYYTFIGIFFTFISTIFARWHVKDGIKETNFYNILCIIIMLLGVVSIFVISGKLEKSAYTDFELFMTTYFGALIGLVFGTFFNDMINGEKNERELKKQMLNKISNSRLKLNWIDVTKKMPSDNVEVLCKNTKGSYFVGYLKSENLGNRIVYQCNSGDEGMSDVIYCIELSEIDKTIPENL